MTLVGFQQVSRSSSKNQSERLIIIARPGPTDWSMHSKTRGEPFRRDTLLQTLRYISNRCLAGINTALLFSVLVPRVFCRACLVVVISVRRASSHSTSYAFRSPTGDLSRRRKLLSERVTNGCLLFTTASAVSGKLSLAENSVPSNNSTITSQAPPWELSKCVWGKALD